MNKLPASFDEQIEILKDMGFFINDENKAKKYLQHIGFYRLLKYFKYFISNHNGENKTFDNVLNYYIFDRKLKLILSDIIERIEISLKANIIDTLSLKYMDPCFFVREDIYFNYDNYIKTTNSLKQEKQKNKAISDIDLEEIKVWKLFQGLSFGSTVFFYRSLSTKNKKEIANNYNLHFKTIYSWLLGLTDIRNICAHYDRLWGKKMTRLLSFEHPKLKELSIDNNSLFSYLLVMQIFISQIGIDSHFLEKIDNLFNEEDYKQIDKSKMGFSNNWIKDINNILK